MCMLCVIRKWSRRIATMLPWLVIPLIGLWALSQLLPPAFRFEITSPRLACVFVLLVTLVMYEILMPQLSAWRVRRNAQLRERKRFEAIELQKLRKTATRRCRNCLTAYRDQNPGGGKFMCSYCGHVSKRPVLDLSLLPSDADNGIIKELVGKGGKILNGKVWNDNGWMCSQDWLEHGNWVAGKSSYWRKNGSVVFGGDEFCLAEKSYSGALFFTCNLLTSFFMSIRWIWRKLFWFNSLNNEASSDEHSGMLAKRSENGVNGNESRGEKARRKAEEKRQARLERELLEEEERKQREEVARLVEERRRLRDEKLEAEKDRSKTVSRDKESKREAEKRRQERRKEKDKGSSKSNSDAEELEKKVAKESERKREVEKKNDNVKGAGSAHSTKNGSANSFNQENVGTRYLNRMRGTLLSSSRAFSGRGFFLRGANANTSNITAKENKIHSSIDHAHSSVHRRDVNSSERIAGKGSINGDDKIICHVPSEPLPTAPKKSWQQLFTRSSSPPPMPNINVISKPDSKPQSEFPQSEFPISQSNGQSSARFFDNPISFGLPLPFIPPVYTTNGTTSSSLGFSPAIEPVFPCRGERIHESTPEDVFEDPCYDPDPKLRLLLTSVKMLILLIIGLAAVSPASAQQDVDEPETKSWAETFEELVTDSWPGEEVDRGWAVYLTWVSIVMVLVVGGFIVVRKYFRAKPTDILSPIVVESFPIIDFDPTVGFGIPDCCICLVRFKQDENVMVLPNCGHIFHPACIKKWLTAHRGACPMCRRDYTVVQVV